MEKDQIILVQETLQSFKEHADIISAKENGNTQIIHGPTIATVRALQRAQLANDPIEQSVPQNNKHETSSDESDKSPVKRKRMTSTPHISPEATAARIALRRAAGLPPPQPKQPSRQRAVKRHTIRSSNALSKTSRISAAVQRRAEKMQAQSKKKK